MRNTREEHGKKDKMRNAETEQGSNGSVLNLSEPVSETESTVLSVLKDYDKVIIGPGASGLWAKFEHTWFLVDNNDITREVVFLPSKGWTVIRRYSGFYKKGCNFDRTPVGKRISEICSSNVKADMAKSG